MTSRSITEEILSEINSKFDTTYMVEKSQGESESSEELDTHGWACHTLEIKEGDVSFFKAKFDFKDEGGFSPEQIEEKLYFNLLQSMVFSGISKHENFVNRLF